MKPSFSTVFTEKELIDRMKAGDSVAFEKIYDHYSQGVYGKLLKLVKINAIADELLQDIFLKVWENRQILDSNYTLRPWLYRVTENEIYKFYRKVALDIKLQTHILQTFDELYTHTEEEYYLKESHKLLQDAMTNMPPRCREVFELCRLQGKSYEETASLLDISTSTVSNHLVRATAIVRKTLFQSTDMALIVVTAYMLHH
ncbi:RNA polymerase sigma factor [Olivibacter domesticus]|uniref:RNA polymerase sigma-70 factor, ECF subfamily n=1 Tax=Olivibacter domesticus TaxID=407022 RepID=A0A1H7U3H3_OLID1|nr:sigma-70 family RNA polymerase sigma factor [Olivibacter domesticus]SEL91642.1 RNA polymerase sigma-70 factor, ECF subfamily [Olivibacter domesticus]